MYNNVKSEYKDRCRGFFYSLINWGETVLTLPNTDFGLEKAILDLHPSIRIDCVEGKYPVYLRQFQIIKDIVHNGRLKLTLSDVFSYLNSEPAEKYDHVWLDLCGPVNFQLIDTIASIVSRIKPEGTLSLTYQRSREKNKNLLLTNSNVSSLTEFRDKIPTILGERILSFYPNRGLELIFNYDYPGSIRAPMTMITFKFNNSLKLNVEMTKTTSKATKKVVKVAKVKKLSAKALKTKRTATANAAWVTRRANMVTA